MFSFVSSKEVKMSKKTTFIANGSHFPSMEKVEEYAKQKGLRVTNTETIHRKNMVIHLITLNK